MEQRRLRLGDILDDYCPRERRVTNHAVVAMIEEDVKQTRCTTCDAEHAYKGGKAPRRRKKETTAALYKEVLAGITDADAPPAAPALAAPIQPVVAPEVPRRRVARGERRERQRPRIPADAQRAGNRGARAAPSSIGERCRVEDGPVHRPLIRAQLPRLEGHKEERQATDSPSARPAAAAASSSRTRAAAIRIAAGRATVRARARRSHRNRPHGAGARFAGSRPGQQTRGASSGRPQGGGFRGGQPPGPQQWQRERERQHRARRRPQALALNPIISAPATGPQQRHVPLRKDRPHRRRRQQALDRLGDRAGGGRGRRAARGDLPGRAARRERPRARRAACTIR